LVINSQRKFDSFVGVSPAVKSDTRKLVVLDRCTMDNTCTRWQPNGPHHLFIWLQTYAL